MTAFDVDAAFGTPSEKVYLTQSYKGVCGYYRAKEHGPRSGMGLAFSLTHWLPPIRQEKFNRSRSSLSVFDRTLGFSGHTRQHTVVYVIARINVWLISPNNVLLVLPRKNFAATHFTTRN